MGSKQETEVERLLLENYETYYRLAYSYARQEQDALDIVQESANKAIRDCKTVRNPDYLATWVFRIATNHLIHYKKHTRGTVGHPARSRLGGQLRGCGSARRIGTAG